MNDLNEIDLMFEYCYSLPNCFYECFSKKIIEKRKKEKETNKEIFEIYDKYISAIASYIEKTSIPYNELSMILLIEKLYSKGILKRKIDNNNKNFFNYGIYTFSGNGVCRHISNLTKDILDKIGMESSFYPSVFTYGSKNDLSNSLLGLSKHVANVIEYNNIKYVFDVYNKGLIYNFISSKAVKCLNSDDKNSELFLEFKPIGLIHYENLSIEEIKKRLEEYEKYSNIEPLSIEEFNHIYNETNYKYNINRRSLRKLNSFIKE